MLYGELARLSVHVCAETYFMAIIENAIAIRALNFNLASWYQMV